MLFAIRKVNKYQFLTVGIYSVADLKKKLTQSLKEGREK